MAIDKMLRFDGIEKNPGVAPVDMTAAFKLPPEQHHNSKCIAFGPDNKLYVPFGAPCNICVPGAEDAQIRRCNADGSGMEVIARGVRDTLMSEALRGLKDDEIGHLAHDLARFGVKR